MASAVSVTEFLPSASVLLVFLAVLLLSIWFLSSHRNLPPGPMTYPIIGNLGDVSQTNCSSFHLKLMEYRRRYGNIFRLYFGFHPVIVLSHPDVIREALVENAEFFSSRPRWMHLTNKLSRNDGIIFNLDHWPTTRKFAMSSMRDFGVGKSPIEEKCQEEINVLTEEFNKYEGKPFNCQMLMANAVSNIICCVIFNKRFDYDDEGFRSMMTVINAFLQSNTLLSVANMYPYVAEVALFLNKTKSNKAKEFVDTLWAFIDENVKQHETTFDEDNIRDFTDIYIASTKGQGGHAKISKDDAFRTILDMFLAGTETTNTTLQWLFIYLMYNTAVQDRCREEIFQVLGTDRAPAMSDRGKLIYTEATLLEVQRIAVIAPLALPHTASCDVMVAGYTVPKDAYVIPNIYSCHRDHEIWGDPDNFRPERWIDENGKLRNFSAFIPFNVGKRACAGDSLARMEIFLFSVTLIQRFKFKMADQRPSLLGNMGITLVPKPFEMIAESLV